MPDDFTRWFTGGADYAYTTLLLCMQGDRFWAGQLVASKVMIFASYTLVGLYLFRRWRAIRRTRFARAMLYGSIVFMTCGSVHLLNGAEYFWPARRLEAILGYSVAFINILFVLQLYRISAVENVLSINALKGKNKGAADAESQ